MSQLEHYKELHQKGQFNEAIEGYKSLLNTEKNNDDIHFSLALALAKIDQLNNALEHTNAAIGLVPHSERYHQFKGQILMGLGELDQAAKSFQNSIKENPNMFFSYLALGDIYTIKQQPEKAKKQFELALKVHESGLPAVIKLARLEMMKGHCELAFSQLQEAALQYPEELELTLQMGVSKIESGEHALAEMYFRQVIKAAPEHMIAHAYLAISLAPTDQQQAAQIVTALTERQVKAPEVMVAMGLLYHYTNRHRQALAFLEPTASSGLAMPSWVMAYAKSLTMLGEADEAIVVLKKQLEQGNNPHVMLLLGQVFQQNGNHAKAAYTLKGIPKTSPLHAQAQVKLSEVLYHKGEYENSLKVAGHLLKKDPQHPAAMKLALNDLAKLNRNEQALTLLEQIDAKKHSNDFNQLMSFYAGLLHDAVGQYEQAWPHFQKVDRPEKAAIELLNEDQEKTIASWPSESVTSDVVFLFADAATGQHEFVNWLLNNQNTVLLDRFSEARGDVFDNIKTFEELEKLDETQVHLLRKKYLKRNRTMVKSEAVKIIDCLPFSMAHAAIAKKIFPGIKVVLLSRNFADYRLHNQIFGTDQVHFSQFTKVVNQMIAMGIDLTVVDIDEWQANEADVLTQMQTIFGEQSQAYQHKSRSSLEQFMMPHMHWKHYKEMMN